ncbi:AMP-binding protein [Dactylosporangium sp. NPDC051485]|uniref:AMP-binding protein n=1 Tax=Dactylosporangium sp. NPDC051485 TaxID=3154846 RepID=UPI003420B127
MSPEGHVAFTAADRDRYRAAGLWRAQPLAAELVAAAERHAGRVALVTEDGTWTYEELLAAAASFAGGIGAVTGARIGDPVMFQMGNVSETVVSYLGCLLAGLRPVCTLPQHGVREIGLLAEHVGATLLITQLDHDGGRLVRVAEQLMAEGRPAEVVAVRGSLDGAVDYRQVLDAGDGTDVHRLPWRELDPEQIAVFQLSGGTTGLPKVAPRWHEEYAYNSRAWAETMHYRPGSVLLYPLPLLHNAGVSLALQPALLAGSRLVLARSANTDTLLDLIEEHRPDVLPLLPPALAIRLLESPRAKGTDFSCLRDVVVGGQRLAVEVAERLRDELGIAVRQMFGMAEGMFLLTPADAGEDVRHHTVGAPISPLDEVRILHPHSADDVPDGDIGEFVTRGPYTIRGYYRAAAHNATAFTPDGFYRTGDLARRHHTPEGVFYSIEGRIKDVINRGVEKIHAEEVEELIARHPGVVNVALVAMPDRLLGEKACAYLVLAPGAAPLTVRGLGEYLLGCGLAKYKLPERVEIVPAFPLTNVGKVAKNVLRQDAIALAAALVGEGSAAAAFDACERTRRPAVERFKRLAGRRRGRRGEHPLPYERGPPRPMRSARRRTGCTGAPSDRKDLHAVRT